MASREWKGFSEEELTLIKKQTSEPDLKCLGASAKQAKFESKSNKKQNQTSKHMQLLIVNQDESPIKPEQALSLPACERAVGDSRSSSTLDEVQLQPMLLKVDSQLHELCSATTDSCVNKNLSASTETKECPTSGGNEQTTSEVSTPLCASNKHEELYLNNNNRHKSKVILEEFEQRQKQLEAENAKRKLLLLQAIEDRKKRTFEETQKIVKIQAELAKLDSLLSTGVSILRSQIEEASFEYDKAHKRYEKAEKEFVEAKLVVYQKLERKERLTEHLCTIIEQNEARKALKLDEMMSELGLETLFDNYTNDSNQMTSLLPQLCTLSEISMKSCQVLKPKTSQEEAIVNNNNRNNSDDHEGFTDGCDSAVHTNNS